MRTNKKLLALAVGSLLSLGGLTFIATSEGERLTAYPDPGTRGAPYTICFGHTGPEVHLGLTVTHEQCVRWLQQDTMKAERVVKQAVHVPLVQGQYDAYVSFVFNAGATNFRRSTMLRKLNAGDWKGSCREFPKWKYANGMVLEGVVVRRYKEQAMCLEAGPYVYRP